MCKRTIGLLPSHIFSMSRLVRTASPREDNASSARGQGLVELAVLLPILLLLIVGAVDMGRMYFAFMTIKNASREAAYVGTTWPPEDGSSTAKIQARAIQEATGTVDVSKMAITSSCPSGCTPGSPVRVSITYDFQMVTTFMFGAGPIRLSTYTEMEIVGH